MRVRADAILAVAAASALGAALSWTTAYDYADDAGPAIDALIHGRWHEFLDARPVMGPFSLIVRAPFAALSLLTGGGDAGHMYESAHKFGIFPCLFAAGLLGLYLAKLLAERDEPRWKQFAVVALCMFGPPSFKAIQYGHAEEILGATLAAGAVTAGVRGHTRWAIVLAACALANKQWGIFVVLPVALTLTSPQLRRAAAALAAAAAVSIIPFALVNAASLRVVLEGQFDLRGIYILPATIWWPFTSTSALADPTHAQHAMPDWLGLVSRPLLVSACLITPLLLARRVREDPVRRALPLLALVLLLRCVLDPLDNAYYHLPFFIALLAAEAMSGTLVVGVLAAVALFVTSKFVTSPVALCAFYLAWAIPMTGYLAARAGGFLQRSPRERGDLRAATGDLKPATFAVGTLDA